MGQDVIVLNFSHPLTSEQQTQVEQLMGWNVNRVIEIPTHLDIAQPFGPQIAALADEAGLTPTEWQTLPLVIIPPSLAPAAVLLLAELHGRSGHFLPCIRLGPTPSTPPRYQVAEVLDVQGQREAARKQRRQDPLSD